jgi:hypothetical protein
MTYLKGTIFMLICYTLLILTISISDQYSKICYKPIAPQIQKDIRAGYGFISVANKGSHVISIWLNNKKQWKIYDIDNSGKGCMISGNEWNFL